MDNYNSNEIDISAIRSQRIFPSIKNASQEGIIAYGGALSPKILLNAYSFGIFPWYSDDEIPIIWWCPDPRMVLFFENLHISKSMKRILNKNTFSFTFDREFEEVIERCRKLRPKQPGTWITENMKKAYIHLHKIGFAHSLEVWKGQELAGGLYGVTIGKCFFGESMFTLVDNASKFAFVKLSENLGERGYHFLDCQISNEHLKTLGAMDISRKEYLKRLKKGLKYPTERYNWQSFK